MLRNFMEKSEKKNQFRKGRETIFFVHEIIFFVTKNCLQLLFLKQ